MTVFFDIFQFLIIFIAHALVGIYSSALKYKKKIIFFVWGVWVLMQLLLYCYVEFVLDLPLVKFLLGFLVAFVGQYLIYFLTTRGRVLQRLFTILTYSLFFCIMMSFYSMILGTFPQMPLLFRVVILVMMVMLLVPYFLRSVCPLCRNAGKNIKNAWYPLIFANLVFLSTVIASSVFPVRLIDFHAPGFVPFLLLSISIFSVYPVVFSCIRNASEVAMKKNIELQNELLLTQIEKENLQREADRRGIHDKRHHDLVLLRFANNNDLDAIKEYLNSLLDKQEQSSEEKIFCNNIIVNTVLSVYAQKAREKGIEVRIMADVGSTLAVSPRDLVVIIANLFENAVNAVDKLKSTDRYIDIILQESSQRFLIKMENSCKNHLIVDEELYGIGIHSVIFSTEIYDGMYDFSARDGKFIAKISLNLM